MSRNVNLIIALKAGQKAGMTSGVDTLSDDPASSGNLPLCEPLTAATTPASHSWLSKEGFPRVSHHRGKSLRSAPRGQY